MSDARNLYTQGNIPEGDDFYYKRYVYLLGDPKLKIKMSSQISSNIISDKIRMDFSNSIPEQMMCYTYAGCSLCKVNKQDCQRMSQEDPDKIVEFNYPLFLDSYIFSTGISSLSGTYYPRMALRFFTKNPIKDISIRVDGRIIAKPYHTYVGQHCFSFNNQNYCPNIILHFKNYASINPSTGEKTIPSYVDVLFNY